MDTQEVTHIAFGQKPFDKTKCFEFSDNLETDEVKDMMKDLGFLFVGSDYNVPMEEVRDHQERFPDLWS